MLSGCALRVLKAADVPGIYKASADWGRSTLVLHPDHSFDQTVTRDDHTRLSSTGTWKLQYVDNKPASHGIIVLQNFIAVDHDHKGDNPGWAAPSISRGFVWGVIIAADPDYGISFDK